MAKHGGWNLLKTDLRMVYLEVGYLTHDMISRSITTVITCNYQLFYMVHCWVFSNDDDRFVEATIPS